ncbi:hypothetical protein Tco_0858895 [Tanacetum coccineum]|uniref:Retrotransposon protein, putative, Ty1-copia subclass n=1 Tax=Tanacetum coccineum TaxID=301880 RepID=A0ABQ5BEG9_9ASTR
MATLNEPIPHGTGSGSGLRRQDNIFGDRPAQTRLERLSKQSNDLPLSRVNTLRSGEYSMKLNELMEIYTKLSERVLALENIKTVQDLEIINLKKRVKKLIESSAEKSLGDQEDASKQERNKIGQDEEILWFYEDAETQGRYGHDIKINTASTSITTLESEEDNTMALELIKFVKKILAELESEEHKNWLVHKQMACGKDFSNPFMVDNLPKIVRFSTHLASVVKSWLVHDQTVHALASPKANELTIPEQTATGKGTSNPLMAGEAAYILGIKIYRDRSWWLIEKLRLSKSQGAATPAELKRMQNVPYASVAGSIMYAVRCTRPDVTFAQNITSRFQQNPELRVSCYTDAGYLTDADDLKSQTRYVFVLNGGVVDWKSSKQSIFTTSSIEAEYIAAYDASKEVVWVRKFIYGLGVVPTIKEPINVYCDNTRAITIANESGITKGARHFRSKVHYLREVIEFGDIKLEKVHIDDKLAGPFTKALAFPKHSEHTKNIRMLLASSLM